MLSRLIVPKCCLRREFSSPLRDKTAEFRPSDWDPRTADKIPETTRTVERVDLGTGSTGLPLGGLGLE